MALAAVLLAPQGAGAEDFPRATMDAGDRLELKGSGNAYYLSFIKVYKAALYGPPEVPAARLLEREVPMCLRIRYDRAVTADDIVKAANVVLRRQHSAAELAPIAARIERLHAAYRDVQAGDRYALCYRSGTGTALSLNDETLAGIEGRDFARAYFGIWLGDDPLSASLKEDLTR